jgi:hypothetical protein
MLDLQVLAFAAGITNVSTLKLCRDLSNRVWKDSGVKTGFHSLSHFAQDTKKIDQFAKLNTYHIGLIKPFFEKLRNTPDGDGNLLEHTLVIYGSPMGDPNLHNHRRCPLFLAGHANGQLKGNLHVKAPDGTPMANVFLTLMRKLGMDLASFGDSRGEIEL